MIGETTIAMKQGKTHSNLKRRQRWASIWQVAFAMAALFSLVVLGVLLSTIVGRGWDWLSWDLIANMASRHPDEAGLNAAIFGTIWVISLTAVIAIPVGIGAAVYLEEYAPRTWWAQALQVNIANLAGVPSIVYGLLGLGIFVELLGLGRVILAGAMTMALLVLPIIIISSQEALRAVPPSLREAAFGVGATRWQVVRHHLLPSAMPGILTGTILSVSRAIGETAPLLVAGAALSLFFRPESVTDSYTVIPIQIYNWTARPQQEFRELAAAGIVVLIVVLLAMNTAAIVLRQRFSQRAR